MLKNVLKRLRYFLGLDPRTPYVKKYIDSSNVRSCIYLSIVVISLELWMIFSVVHNILFSEKKRAAFWIITHISSYGVLLAAGVIMLIYSIRYVKKCPVYDVSGKIIKSFFMIVCIAFGIYISYLDYAKGEQFITLLTMLIFVFCYMVWRPIVSLLVLSFTFILFYGLCTTVIPATYATRVNLFIVWIALLMAAFSAYHQKLSEAIKDERLEKLNSVLEKLSISDEVTGISNMRFFRSQTLSLLHERSVDITKRLFLFLDIENFKNYNEKHGFAAGNDLLKQIAEVVESAFKDDISAHFSNDHFVVFAKDDHVEEKLSYIRTQIQNADSAIKMGLKVGAYRPKDRDCLPVLACDRARYACGSIKKFSDKDYCEYDESMSVDFHRKQYIINNIDTALMNGYIKPYYQPVVSSKTGKLCGIEALARWIDPEFGFLSPAAFVPTLEEYRQIHKLDMGIVQSVCQDIHTAMELNLPVVPVSLNFSRLDFELLDLVPEIETLLTNYKIDKKYIHVEITESALINDDGKLQKAMEQFRSAGYALWLDDFGSGYSGLNVLKEYDFDMMKIDMKFLRNFSGNKKAKSVLKSVVSLAEEIGMDTLTEGVETEEARDFLTEIGCKRLQGYLFGKPMPKEEILQKIKDGTYVLEQ